MTDLQGMAGDFGAECAQEQLGERSGGDPCRGLACGGALENVARIVKIEFLRAGEVRVPGPRGDELLVIRGIWRAFDRQNLLPVCPVAVFDAQGNRCTDGLAVPDAGKKVSAVFLDFLATAAPVAQLATV